MQYQAWQQPPMYPLMLPEAMKPPEKDVEIVYQPQLYAAGEAAVAAAFVVYCSPQFVCVQFCALVSVCRNP